MVMAVLEPVLICPALADISKPAKEAITWKLVNPRRVEFKHWSKDDRMTEELVRTVSEDGQEMTQTRAYLGGKECVDTQVFKRQSSGES